MATAQQEHLKIEQLRNTSQDDVEVIAGRERENLEGWIPELATEAEVREALEKAFDYRGDVTVTRKDGTTVEGYLVRSAERADAGGFAGADYSYAEGWCAGGARDGPYADIAALQFTGRDTAAGKTFEAWIKKYWEKKAAGKTNIQIEPEKLD
jgi:hypothetical protein